MSFRNPNKNDVRFVLTPSCLKESSYHNLHYLRIVVSNTDCVVFFFVLCTLCCQFFWIVHFWLPLRNIFSNFSTTRNRNVILRIHIHFNKLQEKKTKYKQLCGLTNHELRSASPHQDTVGVGSFLASENSKKNLKIPKGQSESVYRRRTDNTMAKRKSTKGQITIYKTYI